MNLFGKILPPTQLRFNSSLKFAIDPMPSAGIRKFGPYDASLFAQNRINCGVIYSDEVKKQKEALAQGLINGEGSSFPGFTTLFRAPIIFDPSYERCVKSSDRGLRQAADEIAAKNCDLVFIIAPQRSEQTYRECKSVLLSNGIPCQFVTAAKLQNPSQRPWVLGNIALASYAKVGGTPWVVADSSGRHELVMGVSRAQEESNKKCVVGFVTLFNQEGDFLLLHSKTPVVRWDDYVKGLEDLVFDAYQEYESRFSAPESLVIHFHKRPGFKELEAVNSALKRLDRTIPYALVHLNEFSAFRLFDTAHSSHVPSSGLMVRLSRRRALLLLDGRENGKRNRMGVPNVWDISLDKRSTIELDEFPRLVSQVQRFARVNWRGFNAKSLPVTINYSKLICDQVLEVGVDSWNSIVGNGRLREKAWFL
jgi:hypothetical protein